MVNKYENFSKDQLIRLLEKQAEELKQKKYGLVWDAEREPEQVVLDCENNLPVLKRVAGKEIRTDETDDNILIEGDNYHALTVLNYTHKGKIDVIYIDPPYNTGNKDFIYNDKYVDKEDGFRHSKWLNFMEKRLKLARDLLKESGVIFISIDDNEVAQLRLLCDHVFGENNFISQIVWSRKRGKDNSAKFFSRTHEYILVYAKNSISTIINRIELSDETKKAYRNPDNDSRGIYRLLGAWARGVQGGSKFEFINKEGKKFSERLWLFNSDSMKRLDSENRLVYVGDKVYRKLFISENKGSIPETIWLDASNAANASDEIKGFFGTQIFETPKPLVFIKRIVSLVSSGNSIVLDFMAGSGTTGHAVLQLNEEDGGSRKFILCTNNESNGLGKELEKKGLSKAEIEEHGICRRITYPRLEKVIKGYKRNGDGEQVKGLGGNLQYFKIDHVKKRKRAKQTRIDLTGKCAAMLCVKENIYNSLKQADDWQIYVSNQKDRFLGIYFNYIEDSFADFYKELKKIKAEKIVYIFSMNSEADKKQFDGIENIRIEAIPEEILEIYRRLVRENIPLRTDVLQYEFIRAKDDIFLQSDKDTGAQKLRIVLERVIKKIAQTGDINIYKENEQEEKVTTILDLLKGKKILTKVEWEEAKTYLAIGNHAAHGEYDEYDLAQVKSFYRYLQSLMNKNGIKI